jgi:hypothetical protein
VLIFVCVFLAATCLFAQQAAPEPAEIPDVPERDIPPRPMRPIDAPAPPDDSIYAKEITIDRSGVTILDREGRLYSLAAGDTATELPHRPPRRDTDRRDIIHVLTDVITIEKNEVVDGDVVCVFGGDIEVLGRVEGMVFTLFGNINVEGTVEDATVAPFGSVRVGPNAKVGGDVVASNIEKEPGGRIGGYRNELFFKFFGDTWETRGAYWVQTTLTVIVLLKTLFWVFLVLLAHALAARNVTKVKNKIQASFFKSFLMGVLVQILLLPAVLLLIMTIVGIPVAVFLIPLMIVAAVILSQAAIGLFLGEKIDENTGLKFPTPLGKTLAGLMAMQLVPLLAVVFAWGTGLDLFGGSFRMLALGLIVLSVIIGYVVVTIGTGAVTMTRFGTRPRDLQPLAKTAGSPEIPDNQSQAKATPLPLTHPSESGTAPVTG